MDIPSLRTILSETTGSPTIVCLHHHLLPTNEYSCLINSYDFLQCCASYSTQLIMHGHRHMSTMLEINNSQLKICGAGSLFFSLNQSGYTNQFQIVTIDGSKVDISVYRYIVDANIKQSSMFDVEKVID